MGAAAANRVVNIRYKAPSGTVTLKNAVYNGIRIRESDSATIISLSQPDAHRSITLDIASIDTVWVGGKARKLKSPGSQHKYREAELKHLLEGKKLEEWTSPYLRSYGYEGIKSQKSPLAALLDSVVGVWGLALIGLPVAGCVAVFAFICYMVWTLFVAPHQGGVHL